MESKSDIKINKILWDKDLLNSRLEFNINGNDINYIVINTLRRVCLTDIPIYAFTKIEISDNTSIFNNNYLKLRIKNLPVLGIKTDISIFDSFKKTNVDTENEDDRFIDMNDDIKMNTDDNINISNLKQLSFYIDSVNDTNSIINIGTDDCKFHYQGHEIKSPYTTNIQIVKLQPGNKIKLSAITELNIEKTNAIFSPLSIFTFREKSKDDYDLILESRGQLNEKEILNIATENILNQLDDVEKILPDDKKLQNRMSLQNYDHTIGNILSYGLQNHKLVEFAGYSMPHPLDENIIFDYKLKSSTIKDILSEIIRNYKKIFTKVNSTIQKGIS